MSKAIVIDNLTKKYGDLTAVDGFSLEVEEGEVFGLLGPNGAGKTTIIRTCLALLNITGGGVSIFGMDSHDDQLDIRRRTGYLPGEFGLIPKVTVKAYLKYLLSLSNVKSDEKMLWLADRLDLDLTRKTNELSKGNRQKVGIVQALMADQDLIILDEPTGGLDPLMQQVFYGILREEKERGKTVFMSSHVLAEIELVCDRVAIIKEGRLILLEHISTLQEMTGKILEAEFRNPVAAAEFEMPGVSNIQVEGKKVSMTISANLDQIVKKVADYQIVNMNLKTYSLDQLFLRYYSDGSDVDIKEALGGGEQK